MTTDPYRRVYALQRRRAAAAEPVGARVVRWVLGLAVIAGLVPLARPTFLWFLGDPTAWGEGLAGAWGRAALLVLVVLALAVHGTVLRGPARAVLQVHPVDPRAVVRQELLAAGRSRLPVVVATLAVMAPVGVVVGPLAWVAGALVVLGAAVAGLAVGAVVFLGAIEAAEHPAWTPLLDALRGNNPRPQAAIIWAIGPATLVGGFVALQAAAGAARVGTWDPRGWIAVVAPWVLAAVALPLVPSLAERTWFRASVVLADIQARYATVEHAEEVRRVWLDWTVRFLPVAAGRWALLDLRYGWRERRTWLSALWLVGVAAFAVGWSDDPTSAARAGLVGGAGAWLAGAVPVLGARDEPAFLHAWLPRSEALRGLARGYVVLAWSVVPVLAAAASAWIRHGRDGLGAALAQGVLLAVLAGLAAAGWALARDRGAAGYAGTAALAVAGAAFLGGGLP